MREATHVAADQSFPPCPPSESPNGKASPAEAGRFLFLIEDGREIPAKPGRREADYPAGSLGHALHRTARERWEGTRGHRVAVCQAGIAITDLAHRMGGTVGSVQVEEVSPETVRDATRAWLASGLTASTVNKRITCLSAMGVRIKYRDRDGLSVRSCFVPRGKAAKWWLRPEDEKKLVEWLIARVQAGEPALLTMIWYVLWTTRTGLRVEETLRLRNHHFSGLWTDKPSVTVPGSKTDASGNTTLALSVAAAEVARSCLPKGGPQDAPMIPWGYHRLRGEWQECREYLGASDHPLATLKALRRSAARELHVGKGMPLDLVKSYLRHTDIKTTMEYLRLVGGYGEEDMRKWLR